MKLENLAAVEKTEGADIIGYLFWYTVSDTKKTYEELENLFEKVELYKRFLPQRIRAVDAFRRAASLVDRKAVQDQDRDEKYNVLIRDISCDREFVQKKIVVEVVDEKGKQLWYYPNCADIFFDRATEEIEIDIYQYRQGVVDVAHELKAKYSELRIYYEGRHLREIVQNILREMAPVPVRPSGGVYFVPKKYEELLHKLTLLIRKFGGSSEAFMMPLINTADAKDMLRQKLMELLQKTLEELDQVSAEDKKYKINELIEKAKSIVKNTEDYRKLLAADVFMIDSMKQGIEEKIYSVQKMLKTA